MNRFVSSSLLAALLWVFALAASPALHGWVHGEDAEHADHECAVTLFTGGCWDSPDVAPMLLVARIFFTVVEFLPGDREVPGMFLAGGTWEHAPPATGA